MRVAKTKRELFINVLDMWLDAEFSVIGEYSAHIEKDKEQARKEYQEYMKMYDKLEEE